MLRRNAVAAIALIAGVVPSHSQQLGLFSKALWYSSKCPAYELDEKRAMEIAVSVGLPNSPSSITVAKNDGVNSLAIPLLRPPERARLSDEECQYAYSLFGPEGSKIPGLLLLKAADQ
ncbi:MAG: hypothetical protein EOS33_07260 [Mesorhizobium sp.]|nr:MAG: hypothetical protein EOS33_07260 [Mesorhizobium sp.]